MPKNPLHETSTNSFRQLSALSRPNMKFAVRKFAFFFVPALLLLSAFTVASPASATDLSPTTVLVRDSLVSDVSVLGVSSPVDPSLAKLGWHSVTLPRSSADALIAANPGSATEPQPIQVALTPNDPWYPSQWEHTSASTPGAWDITTGSNATTIAVVDTGVTSNSDLTGRVLPGHNVLDNSSNSADDHGHGTMAAGTAAGAGNNSFGAAGVCWGCTILPVKVLDSTGSGSTSSVASGIVWASDHGAKIISLSLGGPSGSTELQDAVNYALARDIVVVAAAGNNGATAPFYPAGYSGVVSVGGSDSTANRYSWSNYGSWVQVQAPGCDYATGRDNKMYSFCGTSAAAPYVSGLIGLRRSLNPSEPVASVTSALYATARAPGDASWAQHGVVQSSSYLAWSVPPPDPPPVSPPPAVSKTGFHPVTPTRVLDTRLGLGWSKQRLGPQQTLWFKATGVGGVPSTGVSALSLNLTVTSTTNYSFLTVWPHGTSMPLSSTLNWAPGQTIANLTVVSAGSDGYFGIYNAQGWTDVVGDVNGWFDSTTGGAVGSSLYTPLSPSRLLDTRTGPGPNGETSGQWPLRAATPLTVQIAGRNGVPLGATAATFNFTVTNPTAPSFVTIWPSDKTQPGVSSINFGPGQTIPNAVTVPLSSDGKVTLFSPAGTVDAIIDVNGYFSTTGLGFTPISPTRVLDSRSGPGPLGQVQQSSPITPLVAGTLGIPSGVTSVVLKATVTDTTSQGFATIWPTNVSRPNASSLNFGNNQTIANLVYQKVGTDNRVGFYASGGTPNVVMDVYGYFAP